MNYLKEIYNYIMNKLKPNKAESLPSKIDEKDRKDDRNQYVQYLSNMENFGNTQPIEEKKLYEIKNEILRKLYKDVHSKVEIYNKKLERALEPQIPEKGKLKTLRRIKKSGTFFNVLEKDDNKIPDELFGRYFSVYSLDEEITREVSKYATSLELKIKLNKLDIKDLVGNPKVLNKTYIEAIKDLYSEKGKKSIEEYMGDIKQYWLNDNKGKMCLYDTTLLKIGTKFDNFINNSHLTNICLLCRNSGLTDMQLDMPKGFIESLKNVNMYYVNTPDDLEFIMMFNGIQKIMKDNNIAIRFVLKDDSIKGINKIAIEGREMEFLDTESLIKQVSKIFEEYNLGQDDMSK